MDVPLSKRRPQHRNIHIRYCGTSSNKVTSECHITDDSSSDDYRQAMAKECFWSRNKALCHERLRDAYFLQSLDMNDYHQYCRGELHEKLACTSSVLIYFASPPSRSSSSGAFFHAALPTQMSPHVVLEHIALSR